MPGGSYDPMEFAPDNDGLETGVFRIVDGQLIPLPHVRWIEIAHYNGPQPARATFRYAYPPDSEEAEQVLFEHFLPIASSETGQPLDLLKVDDRICVLTIAPEDGRPDYLFDGFVQIPEGAVEGNAYGLHFQAQGTPIRLWDEPLYGSERRSVFTPSNHLLDRKTDLAARVNPEGKANATGDPDDDGSWDHETDENEFERTFKYPVFFDDLYPDDSPLHSEDDKPYVRKWTLDMAARYLLAKGNGEEEWVDNPDFDSIVEAISTAVPTDGGIINPDDPDSYEFQTINCPDAVLSARPWPDVLNSLIAPHGFSFVFRIYTDENDLPRHYIDFIRVRDNIGATHKDLHLQARYEDLVVGESNTAAFSIARDASQVVNSLRVEASLNVWEVGVVMVPLFHIAEGDDDNADQYKTGNPDPDADRDAYRLFGLDECGEGHWSFTSSSWVSGVGAQYDFSSIFGADKWVVRRRKPGGTLVTRDASGNQRQAFLGLLTQWNGTPPALWDGTGEFRPLKTSFRLLRDRIGVRLTCGNPSALSIGDAVDDEATLTESEIDIVQRLVATLSDPDPLNRVHFVLVCAIEADEAIRVNAVRRASSPTQFDVKRVIEGDDRYRRDVIHKSSWFFSSASVGVIDTTENYKTVREDTTKALHYAQSKRSATDVPSFGGSIVVPRLVKSYRRGDRIRHIAPRMSLQTNALTEHEEGPRYPTVVATTWHNDPGQQTILHLDDRRAEGEPIEA